MAEIKERFYKTFIRRSGQTSYYRARLLNPADHEALCISITKTGSAPRAA